MTPTTAHVLYLVFALGGAAVYFLLPKAPVSQTRAGAIFGLLALAGFFIVLATRIVSPGTSNGSFYVFSTIAVVAAVRVVSHPRPVYSALYFVLVVIAVAALLVLQRAEFLAIALIIIYAGAILVTYLFVIMLAQQAGSPTYDRRAREPFLAVLAGFVLMAAVAGRAQESPQPNTAPTQQERLSSEPVSSSGLTIGNSGAIGSLVMTRYVVVLEIAGVLLLVSMIGAIAMSKKQVPTEGPVEPKTVLGEVGRKVEPF